MTVKRSYGSIFEGIGYPCGDVSTEVSLDSKIPKIKSQEIIQIDSKVVQKRTQIDSKIVSKPFLQNLGDGQVPAVFCRVCNGLMDVSCQLEESTVACPYCNEATAINPASPGYKYVICPCNALLVCKDESDEFICPRNDCNKKIKIPTNQETAHRVLCSNCQYFFLTSGESDPYATCPSCHTVQRLSILEQNDRPYEDCILVSIFMILMIAIFIGAYGYVMGLSFIYTLCLGLLAFLVILPLYYLHRRKRL